MKEFNNSKQAKALQDGIAKCNGIINEIEKHIDKGNKSKLQNFINCEEKIPNASIELGNALIDYSQSKHKVIRNDEKRIKIIVPFLFALLIVIAIILAKLFMQQNKIPHS